MTLLRCARVQATCEEICYLTTSSTFRFISRTKLSLSHALSQSVKISLVSVFLLLCAGHSRPLSDVRYRRLKFEELISTTIVETKEYPEIISETGKIGLPHKGLSVYSIGLPLTVDFILPTIEIMRKMGEVFLLRANIAAVGSVLDSPEVFWVSTSAGVTDQDVRNR